jgi:hypothetical protein
MTAAPFMASSMTKGAAISLCRKPATKVSVFEWPTTLAQSLDGCVSEADNRAPRAAETDAFDAILAVI